MKLFLLGIFTGAAIAMWHSGFDPLRFFGFRHVYYLRPELPFAANSSSTRNASSKRARPRISDDEYPCKGSGEATSPYAISDRDGRPLCVERAGKENRGIVRRIRCKQLTGQTVGSSQPGYLRRVPKWQANRPAVFENLGKRRRMA